MQPRSVSKSTHDKYWFACQECFHNFDSALNNIVSGKWCPYCSNPCRKLCNDNNCNFCFNNSFASVLQAQFWHDEKNGNIQPRNVSKSNGNNFWFKCQECLEDFNPILSNVTAGSWCPYCVNKTEGIYSNI